MSESASAINVLIVEDSAVSRELLVHVLGSDPQIRIAGIARDGAEAIAMLDTLDPDVITMDIHMPGIDGYRTTRRIMETRPVPIVIVTASYDPTDVTQAFRAVEAGAVAIIDKPPGIAATTHTECAQKLINTVKAMSQVRVVKRTPRIQPDPVAAAPNKTTAPAPSPVEIVAIGGSTGGPLVLQEILAGLPRPFPVPILIVQHISAGFVEGLATWLAQSSGLPVRTARDGDRARAGHVYLAPDGVHMRVEKGGLISCVGGEPENGLCPAVSCLFRSVAGAYGAKAAGVLLSGMGRDGAIELKLMRERGAVTVAQDRETCVVNGMPGAAVEIGAATHVLAPGQIAAFLSQLTSPSNRLR
jgi:two-component system chemotaxis response regulator CheB